MMDRREAEDYVYSSYLKAQKFLDPFSPDSCKRHPEFSKDILKSFSETPSVIVTGSKGKGSVASMIERILQLNFKTGLFTSPHISDFRERFKINGKVISETDFVTHIEKVKELFDPIEHTLKPHQFISPIGIQAALSLSYFNRNQTSFNIFECGKGARYDDVCNIYHRYAVINSIFPEHTRELGKTLKEIAIDKAHVITGDQKCVFAATQPSEALEVIKKRAETLSVPLKIYGKNFKSENIKYSKEGMMFDVITDKARFDNIKLPLLGAHQAKNCALAVAVCEEVLESIDPEDVRKQLSGISWPGRMQILSSEPFIMLDACINAGSAEYVKDTLDFLKLNHITLIAGIPDDKDYIGVVKSMSPYTSKIILTRSNNPHYIFTKAQQKILKDSGISTLWHDKLEDAIEEAKFYGNPFVILGTTSLVAEVLTLSADW